MDKAKIILVVAALLTLAGCSSGPTRKAAFEPSVSRSELDPLLDAPLRMQTQCKGVTLFSAGERLGGFSFECPDLDVIATMNELRDAGWRVEKMSIGRFEVTDTQSGAPVSCIIRKVY